MTIGRKAQPDEDEVEEELGRVCHSSRSGHWRNVVLNDPDSRHKLPVERLQSQFYWAVIVPGQVNGS